MSFGSVAAAFVAVAALPNGAHAQGSAQVQAAIRSEESGNAEVRAFYQSHRGEPLWIRGSAPGPQAAKLLQLFESAQLDGLNPEAYRTRSLASTLSKARRGSPKALAAAEIQLSEAFAAYVRDSRKPRGKTEMLYAEKSLAPTVPTVASVLEAAAAAPNIVQYLESMGWMHPVYAQLRGALATSGGGKSAASPRAQLLRLNLERARILPGNPRMRHILVDAAGARLWLYENGRIRDTMKVVVGQPTQQTPMMAGLVRYAIANPYWYVPSDLAARRIAPNVLSGGPSYLRARRYEILSDWSANAKVVPPAKVNWRAVADGKQQLAMRQLPGGDNAMGKVKFMFPNDLGIYLHDTPDKQLFGKAERHLSNGCVRVEDYQRLAKWLMGKPLPVKGKKPEQQINLAEPVPIYITYLTAAPEEKRIAYHPDVYNRDLAQVGLAGLGGGGK